jgi:multiple RNA-binding domain-containing protein 1
VSKSELLDPTSADAAVKQAIAETFIIQSTKEYFASNGVNLDAFKTKKRGGNSILVKQFGFGTTVDELRTMFEEHGPVLRVLMPPAGTIALVQFAQPGSAKAAFSKLAYRRIKGSIMLLEKAPQDLFVDQQPEVTPAAADRPAAIEKLSGSELLVGDEQAETNSLFVRNLSFATTTDQLAEAFGPQHGFVSAQVKTKLDPKKPGERLSMGFGFVHFRSREDAAAAQKALDGHVLHGHALSVRTSQKSLDAVEEKRREDRAKKIAAKGTKIVIKNLPFEATKKDVRSLVGKYGQVRVVRMPKKFGNATRGFAFAEFATPIEAGMLMKFSGMAHST